MLKLYHSKNKKSIEKRKIAERKNMKYRKERNWIKRKLRTEKLTQEQLLHTVGIFSNKKKERVMKEKNINSKQYDERYKFLANVYCLLSSEKF